MTAGCSRALPCPPSFGCYRDDARVRRACSGKVPQEDSPGLKPATLCGFDTEVSVEAKQLELLVCNARRQAVELLGSQRWSYSQRIVCRQFSKWQRASGLFAKQNRAQKSDEEVMPDLAFPCWHLSEFL